MDNSYHIDFDDSKDIETFFDFHGIQILKTNTPNSTRFLEEGMKFDQEILKRLDEKKRCKVIFVGDQIPALSALLKYVENPFDKVTFGIYAIIMPKDPSLINLIVKFTTSFLFSLTMSKNEGKYAVRLFDNSHRNDLTEIAKWMEETAAKKDRNEEIKMFESPIEPVEEKTA